MATVISKTVAASRTIMNEIVLPNDTNTLGNLMGGRLLHWMDICAAISAQRHTNRVCVTAAVDNVEFHSPIVLGEVVTLESQVNRVFRTSMEVEINVWAENPRTQERRKCNRAYYTFVSVDDELKAVAAPQIEPESREEQQAYDEAAGRREIRLVLAGRLDLKDAKHLSDGLTFSRITK
ncbi:MAG: acyl-CoA thioesterase [Rhodothermales bacterium]|nr:acyl-CoA thioesterase [Rhodothermales bacterium]